MSRGVSSSNMLLTAFFDFTVSSYNVVIADVVPSVPVGRFIGVPAPNVGGAKIFVVWSIRDVNYELLDHGLLGGSLGFSLAAG